MVRLILFERLIGLVKKSGPKTTILNGPFSYLPKTRSPYLISLVENNIDSLPFFVVDQR